MSTIEKVAIIGLDCADPHLMFERFVDDLPTQKRLMAGGTFGKLESSLPPITVPAWSCMASSKDPGTLGIYGFRNRADYSYDKLSIATSLAVKEPRLWDILSQQGKKVIVLGVPGTFPITKPPNGIMVTSFMTPGKDSDYTWPRELKAEIDRVAPGYQLDVKDFRTNDKERLVQQIHDMTRERFKLAKHLVTTKEWDFFWMVEMGPDRLYHGFWQYTDPHHHRYEAGNPLENVIRDYHKLLDEEIGGLLEAMDLDKTALLWASDHGAQLMHGGLCFNDWLIQEGYLVLEEQPTGPTRFADVKINWKKTRAWGEGGYYARCFINVKGREPNGVVKQRHYQAFRDELIGRLESMVDHNGKPMGTKVYKPEEVYDKVNNVPPDLIVLFGNLNWRSVGTVGNPSIYTFENDTGPDDANHARYGMYLLHHPSLPPRGRVDSASLYDVAPTVLKLMGLPVPGDMRGKSLV
ncbi:MAG: alkaline phosphatase family protein [Phycisphaerae bacterium]|nr:alkaline phosphatase family protein [Phycisphaerae bacterium]